MRNPESNTSEEEREPQAPPKVDPKFAEERVGGQSPDKPSKNERQADYNTGKKHNKKVERGGENYDYEILGVSKDASREEINAAYRELAKKTHPDMGGDAGDFKKVNAAYESLTNRQNGGQKKERGSKSERSTDAGAEDMSEREKRMREKARQTEENIRKAREQAEEEIRKAREEVLRKFQEATERMKKEAGGEKPKEETKKCPNCGAEMPISANFCRSCGNKFGSEKAQNKCSNCGTPLREGASFCGACGTKVK